MLQPGHHSVSRPGDAPDRQRRGLLSWLLGGWATGVVGAVFYPVLRYLVPPDVPEAPTLAVGAGPAATLAANSGRVVPFGSEPAIVIRLPTGELRAFSATCTHLSCTVQYRPDLQQIWCACHNGHYNLNGLNVSGPPPRPLEAYDANVANGEITISRKR
jgi:cytochrome b6-f complex iron-sulfur subunit